MKCFVLSLALFELLLWHKGSARFLDEDCGFSKPPEVQLRIANGNWAEPGTTPWVAAVSNQHEFLCGGTLISRNFVLTAAHCIDGEDQLFVKLGIYDRSCTAWSCRDAENYTVTRAIRHRNYDSQQFTNDIGLLKLNAEVQYKDHIRPICIVIDDSLNLKSISGFTAFGWGKTQTGQHSQLLKAIPLYRRVPEECHYDYMQPLTEKQICAGSVRGDTCQGDSGGPLATILEDRYVQVGLVSYGTRRCNASGIYTDVSSYKDWIVAQTRSQPDAGAEADYIEDNSVGRVGRLIYEECAEIRADPGYSIRPWTVNDWQYQFTGVLVTDRYVVTTASALSGYSPSNLKLEQRGLVLYVDSIVKHPRFEENQESVVNDIALIRLSRRVQVSASRRPICVGPNLHPQKDLTLLSASRGIISQEPLHRIDPNTCEGRIGRSVASHQFCTEQPESSFFGMRGSVVGIIGRIGANYKYFLTGILSAKRNGVSVFTNIEDYVSWIRNTIY